MGKPEIDRHSSNEVSVWLRDTVRLSEYIDLFMENGMENMDVILLLTENELDIMNIEKLGHRMKILNEIEKLKENKNERKRGSLSGDLMDDDGPRRGDRN